MRAGIASRYSRGQVSCQESSKDLAGNREAFRGGRSGEKDLASKTCSSRGSYTATATLTDEARDFQTRNKRRNFRAKRLSNKRTQCLPRNLHAFRRFPDLRPRWHRLAGSAQRIFLTVERAFAAERLHQHHVPFVALVRKQPVSRL